MLSYIHIATVHMTLDFHVWIFWMIHASEDVWQQQSRKLKQEMRMYSYGVWHLSVPYPYTSVFVRAAEASVTFSFFMSELFALVADNNMIQRIVWFHIFETQGSAEFSNASHSAWDGNLALR